MPSVAPPAERAVVGKIEQRHRDRFAYRQVLQPRGPGMTVGKADAGEAPIVARREQQRARCGTGRLGCERQGSNERILVAAKPSVELVDPKEKPREPLMDAEPDEDRR